VLAGNKGLAGITSNPVLANGIMGLATSATAQATIERFVLWTLRDTVSPSTFNAFITRSPLTVGLSHSPQMQTLHNVPELTAKDLLSRQLFHSCTSALNSRHLGIGQSYPGHIRSTGCQNIQTIAHSADTMCNVQVH